MNFRSFLSIFITRDLEEFCHIFLMRFSNFKLYHVFWFIQSFTPSNSGFIQLKIYDNGNANIFFLKIFFFTSAIDLHLAVKIETTKQWNLLKYNLPLDFPANDLEFYNPQNVVATGFAIADNRLFLATPRLFSGVPATLSV